jgi:hypothetical protein
MRTLTWSEATVADGPVRACPDVPVLDCNRLTPSPVGVR